MNEINDENELNQDEEKSANQPEVHEHLLKRSVARDVKCAHDETDKYEHLEEPKAVLNVRPWVSRGAHVQHDDHEEKVEAGERETNSIHRKIALLV